MHRITPPRLLELHPSLHARKMAPCRRGGTHSTERTPTTSTMPTETVDPTEAPFTVMSDAAAALREAGREDLAERMGEALGEIRSEEDDVLTVAVKAIEGLRYRVNEQREEIGALRDALERSRNYVEYGRDDLEEGSHDRQITNNFLETIDSLLED